MAGDDDEGEEQQREDAEASQLERLVVAGEGGPQQEHGEAGRAGDAEETAIADGVDAAQDLIDHAMAPARSDFSS